MVLLQYEIDDTSPVISYQPSSDLDPLAGWRSFYRSNVTDPDGSPVGIGASYHLTHSNDASLSLQWNGTGVTLFGSTLNAAVDFFLDGALTQPNASSPETNILASFHNLTCIVHDLQMNIRITDDRPRNSSYVTFDRALIQFPSPSTQTNISARIVNSTELTQTGNWTPHPIPFPESASRTFTVSSKAGDTASLQFNGTGVFVHGRVSPDAGNYTVGLDGQPPLSFSARSAFVTPDALLFLAVGLDSNVTHQLTIVNLEDKPLALGTQGLDVAEVQNNTGAVSPSTSISALPSPTSSFATQPSVTSSPTTSSLTVASQPPPRLSDAAKGTIAALVLAGFLLLIVCIVLLLFFLWWRPRVRRRRRQRRDKLRQRRRLESVFSGMYDDKGMAGNIPYAFSPGYVDEEDVGDGEADEYRYILSGANQPDATADNLGPRTSIFVPPERRQSKGKGKAVVREKTWSNITIDIPIPSNVSNAPSASLKRSASWSSSLDLRFSGPNIKGLNFAPLSYAQSSALDRSAQQHLSPSSPAASLPQTPEPQDGSSLRDDRASVDDDPGEIVTAALALSPRTSALGSQRRSLWSRRGSWATLFTGTSDDKVTVRFRDVSPFQVEVLSGFAKRSREALVRVPSGKAAGKSRRRSSRGADGAFGPSREGRVAENPPQIEDLGLSETVLSDDSQRDIGPSTGDNAAQIPDVERFSFLDLTSSKKSTAQDLSPPPPPPPEPPAPALKRLRWSETIGSKDTTQQPPSRWSAATAPSVGSTPSEQSQDARNIVHPFASQQVPLSSQLGHSEGQSPDVSPTDSLPVTVSDINFRHSISDKASGLPSARNSRRISANPQFIPPGLSSLARSIYTRYHPISPSNLASSAERRGSSSLDPTAKKLSVVTTTPPPSHAPSPSVDNFPEGSTHRPRLGVNVESPRPSPAAFLANSLKFSPGLGKSRAPPKSG